MRSLLQVEYFEVGSPVTNRYYIGSARGEIYGLDHDTSRFSPEVVMSLRPETDIPGLYLTGKRVSHEVVMSLRPTSLAST